MRTVIGGIILLLFIKTYPSADQEKYFVTQATVLILFSFCGLYTSAYFINKKIRKFLKVQNTINFLSALPLLVIIFAIEEDQKILIITAFFIAMTKSINDFYKTDNDFNYFVGFTSLSIVITSIVRLALIIKSFDITILIDFLLLEEFVRQMFITLHYSKKNNYSFDFLNLDYSLATAKKILKKNVPIFLSTYLASNKIRALILLANWLYPNSVLQVSYSVKVYDLLLGLNTQISTYIWAKIRGLEISLSEIKLRLYIEFYFKLTTLFCTLGALISYVFLQDYFYLFCVLFVLPIMALSPCLVQILIRENQYKRVLLVELFATGTLSLMILIYGLFSSDGDFLVSFASCLSLFLTYTFVIQRSKYSRYTYSL